MEVKEISARSPKLDRETVVMVNFGENAEESVEMFGAEAVNSNAFANYRVTDQAGIRRGHDANKSDEQIADEMEKSKMGVALTGAAVDPIQASLLKFKTMNAEEQAEYLEKLKAAAAEG